jgi:hypothetical protein
MLDGGLGFVCAFASAAAIAALAASDPKRRRARRGQTNSTTRWTLLLATLIPGITLAAAGRWTDVLVWVGAAAVLGWAIAALSNLKRKL